MGIIRPAVLALWLLGCGWAQVDDIVQDVRKGATFRLKIHSSLPEYVFHLVGNAEDNIIEKIEISREGKLVQTEDVAMNEPPPRNEEYFQAVDINFDGYADIKLLSWWGGTGNKGYNWWLFNPKSGTFVYQQELSGLSNPVPNPKTKEITTYSKGGMAGMVYGQETYRFDGDRLVLMRSVEQNWVDEKKHFVKVTRERKNGTMQVVKEELVSENPLGR